jgi:hypothetical protein
VTGLAAGSPFQWLDHASGVIHQYCSMLSGFRSMSVDGRFAAFTRVELLNPQPAPKATFILNLTTGQMAQIDDFEFVGWAKSSD